MNLQRFFVLFLLITIQWLGFRIDFDLGTNPKQQTPEMVCANFVFDFEIVNIKNNNFEFPIRIRIRMVNLIVIIRTMYLIGYFF